ncbi:MULTISPECIES: IS701 family transposase [Streptomyces]|nr:MULTISPECIES: transposase [Streptomyces]
MNAPPAHVRSADPGPAPLIQRLFAHLPRADQRRWAEIYLAGLLGTQGKKSVGRMAAAVTLSPTASQSLQQFINVSPWSWGPVRAELARWVADRAPVHSLTLAPVIVPKRGTLSVGVHRRFVPALGRTVNCQLAMGAFLTGDAGARSVDWQLYLPRRWAETPELRERARLPETLGYASASALCLALLDRVTRALPSGLPVLVDPAGHLEPEALVRGLEARGHDWIVAIPGTMAVIPAAGPASDTALALLRRQARAAGAGPAVRPTPLRPVLRALRARVPFPGLDRERLLVGEWTGPTAAPDRIWLSNLPRARHGQARVLIAAHATTSLGGSEAELGLHDFAGRSYPGWHRHATLVSAAAVCRRLAEELGGQRRAELAGAARR